MGEQDCHPRTQKLEPPNAAGHSSPHDVQTEVVSTTQPTGQGELACTSDQEWGRAASPRAPSPSQSHSDEGLQPPGGVCSQDDVSGLSEAPQFMML